MFEDKISIFISYLSYKTDFKPLTKTGKAFLNNGSLLNSKF
jgi:hypothetical protein